MAKSTGRSRARSIEQPRGELVRRAKLLPFCRRHRWRRGRRWRETSLRDRRGGHGLGMTSCGWAYPLVRFRRRHRAPAEGPGRFASPRFVRGVRARWPRERWVAGRSEFVGDGNARATSVGLVAAHARARAARWNSAARADGPSSEPAPDASAENGKTGDRAIAGTKRFGRSMPRALFSALDRNIVWNRPVNPAPKRGEAACRRGVDLESVGDRSDSDAPVGAPWLGRTASPRWRLRFRGCGPELMPTRTRSLGEGLIWSADLGDQTPGKVSSARCAGPSSFERVATNPT